MTDPDRQAKLEEAFRQEQIKHNTKLLEEGGMEEVFKNSEELSGKRTSTRYKNGRGWGVGLTPLSESLLPNGKTLSGCGGMPSVNSENLTQEQLLELRNNSTLVKKEVMPDGTVKEILSMEDTSKYRNMMLPKEPKGYPPLNTALSVAGADYERMMSRPKDNPIVGMHIQCLYALPDGEQQLAVWQISSCQRWIKNGQKIIYPTPEIVEACKNTDAMSSVMGKDIKTTHPSFLLVMPKGCGWVNSAGSEVSHVIVNLMENEGIRAKFGEDAVINYEMPGARYLVLSMYWDDGGVQNMSVPIDSEDRSIGELLKEYTGEEHHIHSYLDNIISEEERESDSLIGYKIADFVFNTFLVMQSYPQYITTTEQKHRGLDSKKRNKTTKVSVIATPTAMRQQVPHTPKESVDKGGTREIKTHIRRGHWRRQRHLEQWEIDNPEAHIVIMPDGGHAHMRWIRPVMVEGSKGTDK